MSQKAVAKRAGVSIDTVRRAELGLHEPGANAIGRIAAALGVSIDSLFVHEADGLTSSADDAHDGQQSPGNTNAPVTVGAGAGNAGGHEGASPKE